MFAQQQRNRRRFFGLTVLSLASAWIGTRDSVQLITMKPFRPSGASDLAAFGPMIRRRSRAWNRNAIRPPVPFRVPIDGRPPSAGHGSDVDEQGNGTVTEQRLYQLIRQSGSTAGRQFEIEFLDSGVEAFAFTFG